MFPVARFQIVDAMPAPKLIAKTVRSWDKAGTADGGAFTAGAKMHKLYDGMFLISDMRRGQLAALEREQLIKQTASVDGPDVRIIVEQEPGSGGKESAEATIRMLAGYTAIADKPTGAKEIRADPYAAQVQAGNVQLLKGDWNREFLDEHEHFPVGTYMDQVDACSAAFSALTLGSTYDSSLRWV
jgi:predicted phage terminase large subunit-like protein